MRKSVAVSGLGFGLRIALAAIWMAVGLPAAVAGPLQLAQGGECPAGYPVDCGDYCCPAGNYCTDGGCCPNGTWDSGDGYCIPDGHPYCGDGKYCNPGDTIACRGYCYRGAREAVEDGCPVSEHIVCGGPVQ